MALENTFGLNDQTVSNDFEAANQMVASEVENSQVNGAELDFSTAEDPFGDLLLKEITKKSEYGKRIYESRRN